MNKKTYLSVDIDFWNLQALNIATKELKHILKNIEKYNIPYYICEDHAEILKHIKKFKNIEHLINIDAHSDFADLVEEERIKDPKIVKMMGNNNYIWDSWVLDKRNLNCGTWVNFVQNRENATYTWVKNYCLGRCHSFVDPFEREVTSWKKCEIINYASNENIIEEINYEDICGVGISLSYEYIEAQCLELIELLHDFSGQTFPSIKRILKKSHCSNMSYDILNIKGLYNKKVFGR